MKSTLFRRSAGCLLAAALFLAGVPAAAESSAAVPPVPLRPKAEKDDFASIQERCVQPAQIRFGVGERWSDYPAEGRSICVLPVLFVKKTANDAP